VPARYSQRVQNTVTLWTDTLWLWQENTLSLD
jgi:hypothetical protein